MPMVALPLRELPAFAILFFCANSHKFLTLNFLGTIKEQTWHIAKNFAELPQWKTNLDIYNGFWQKDMYGLIY
jgi:hypothetical protein